MADREPKVMPAGYWFIVDGEGAEVPGSRRPVPAGMEVSQAHAIADALERGMGPDCSVEFRAD